MSCRHKEYTEMDFTFTTLAKIAGTNKVMDVLSHICICKKCGVLFVPRKLREIPQLNTIREEECN